MSFAIDFEARSFSKIDGGNLVLVRRALQRALGRSAAPRRLEDGLAGSDAHGRRVFIRTIRRLVVATVGGAVALTDAAAEVLGSRVAGMSGRACGNRHLQRRDEEAEACVQYGS